MLFLSSLAWTIYFKMHILFFKKVLIILRYNTKHANFWLGVQCPLNYLKFYTGHRFVGHIKIGSQKVSNGLIGSNVYSQINKWPTKAVSSDCETVHTNIALFTWSSGSRPLYLQRWGHGPPYFIYLFVCLFIYFLCQVSLGRLTVCGHPRAVTFLLKKCLHPTPIEISWICSWSWQLYDFRFVHLCSNKSLCGPSCEPS